MSLGAWLIRSAWRVLNSMQPSVSQVEIHPVEFVDHGSWLMVIAAGLSGDVKRQDASVGTAGSGVSYPRVNLATGYDVDPSGRRTGIALGRDGWDRNRCGREDLAFNRGNVPVQVYSAAGMLVRSGERASFGNRTRCASTAREMSGWLIVVCTSFANSIQTASCF